jgi:plasmid maintenance system killer protein
MASYKTIVQAAMRPVTVKLEFAEIPGQAPASTFEVEVLHRLYQDPARYREIRSDLEKVFEKAKQDIESSEKPDQLAALEQVRLNVMGMDDRKNICGEVERIIAKWNLEDDKGKAVSLAADSLYKGEVPTELLAEILKQVKEAPLVPNSK